MRAGRQLIIGITGGIAAGKSTVLKILKSIGFQTFDADKIAHSLYRRGNPGFEPVVNRFGSGILSDETGEIDRGKLGAAVFAHPADLADLEKILYPLIIRELEGLITTATRDTAVEAVKLFSSGLDGLCDETWFVRVDPEIAAARLTSERGLSAEEALLRISAQRETVISSEALADWTIQGTADREQIKSDIINRLDRLRTEIRT